MMETSAQYRDRLYTIFDDGETTPEEKVERALTIGAEYLDVEVGFLTRIGDGRQEIVRSTGSHELLQAGNSCPLDESYCQRTIETPGTLSVQAVGEGGVVPEVAVDRFGLDSYIGAKVEVDGDLYGTVCFADRTERDAPFDEAEELFVELLSELAGQAFERASYTERLRRRNERLQTEKRRFERIADASFDIIFRLDASGRFTYVSPAVERVLGYDPATLVEEPFTEFVTAPSVEIGTEALGRVLDGEVVEALELEFLSADGERATLEVNATPVDAAEADGAVVQGVGRDVTARRERQRALRVKNRAMDEADIGIVIADATTADNDITYVNDGFVDLTGYAQEEILGENCRMLQGPASDEATVATLRESIDAERPVQVDIVNYRACGRPFWNELSITPVEGPDGTVQQYLGFQRDVTERKRRQQLFEVLNRVLRHNLRNKMALLGARSADGAAGPPPEVVDETVAELMALADGARDLYRVAQEPPDPERIDVGRLVAEVAERVGEDHARASVTVDVGTDRDACAGPTVDRAVQELVENAVVHSDGEVAVDVSVQDAGDAVTITVTDDGCGVSEMETEFVEEGYETQLSHGSGLGLWLVNWIVTQYGGSFHIAPRSDGESGTVATVELQAIGPDQTVGDVDCRPTVLSN